MRVAASSSYSMQRCIKAGNMKHTSNCLVRGPETGSETGAKCADRHGGARGCLLRASW